MFKQNLMTFVIVAGCKAKSGVSSFGNFNLTTTNSLEIVSLHIPKTEGFFRIACRKYTEKFYSSLP